MGAVIHFTGGVLSPFIFALFAILLSDASHGIEYPGLTASLAVYFGVIGLEWMGIIRPLEISPKDIYGSWFTLIAVTSATALLLVVTSQTYTTMMKKLRSRLDAEQKERERIRIELSRLEAPSQIGLLVNKIAHDLRGPLGAISGFISVLKRENNFTDDSLKDCEIMMQELNRIQNMVGRMLLYSRPGVTGRETLCPVELLENVLTVFSFYPGAKNITFAKRFPSPREVGLYANKEALQQVYFNLLKNALEAGVNGNGKKPTIAVSVEQAGEDVVIQIADDGPGIPTDILQKLGREITSTKKEGGGVGLIISREIVESHSGRFEIKSSPKDGTKISTIFPLRKFTPTEN